MRMSALLALLVATLSVTALAEEWRPLFNGKNLEGWTPKICGYEVGENFGNTFRVEEGLLKVVYDQYEKFEGRFGHLFFDESFSNYRLRVEYRVIGQQLAGGAPWARMNSGIMIHGQSPESMGLKQNFPVSIEVQFLSGVGEENRPTGNLCTPGTHVVREGNLFTQHCVSSSSPTFPVGEWVTAEVEAHGGKSIKHLINGQVVLEYEAPQFDPKDKDAEPLIQAAGGTLLIERGTLSLQSESHPMEFRKVEILVLEE